MKIDKIQLQESKTKLPVSFLTNFLSTGWETLGNLKEEKAAIKEAFTGTGKVEEILQDLIDAYLICLGQIQLIANDKKYLDFDFETEAKQEKVVTEALSEDLVLNIDNLVVNTQPQPTVFEPDDDVITTDFPDPSIDTLMPDAAVDVEPVRVPEAKHCHHYENTDCNDDKFICDFDEPDLAATKLSDDELENLYKK